MSETAKQTANVWMAGQESSGGIMVKMYSDHPQVVHPVVKLYDRELDNPTEDLAHLPKPLLKQMQRAGVSEIVADPLKNVAEAKGWLIPLEQPLDFYVVVQPNGKTSKRVDWEVTERAWAGGGPAGSASVAGSEQMVYEGFVDERHNDLLGLVVEETIRLGTAALQCAREWKLVATGEPTDDELFKAAFYRVTKMFDTVRGAWLMPATTARNTENPFGGILNGTIETFAEDLAGGHYLIQDAEAARGLIEDLGIKITREHVEDVNKRVEVAQQVWLFVDIVERYGQKPSEAKVVIDNLFNQVPW